MIKVNGHGLEVTENCEAALQELRREARTYSKPHVIWIDAICINQKDLRERNHQVNLMLDIYHHCQKLIIWLGLEMDGSEKAIATLKDMVKWNDKGMGSQWKKRFMEDVNHFNRWLEVAKFYSRPWFTRAWVAQEYMVCARKNSSLRDTQVLEFYCGKCRLPGHAAKLINSNSSVAAALSRDSFPDDVSTAFLRSAAESFARGRSCFLNINLPGEITAEFFSSEIRFFSFIFDSLGRGATDPRDHIYAFSACVYDQRKIRCDNIRKEVPQRRK